MAENSAFWLGTTLGDAASATGWKGKYSDENIANIQSLILGNNDSQGFVIPGYNNRLAVSTTGAMSVSVATGAAFVRGKLYENTVANTLTVTANASGNPRLDRVVIRITYASQTIRLAVLAGTAAATPALPVLTQNTTTYEVSLAYLWVANGAASIAATDIHDEREFLATFATINDSYGTSNLITNSEFMAFSYLEGAPTTNPPDYWNLVLTPSDIANYTKPSQMSRGRAVQITTDAASEGISQIVLVKASTMYSIKLLTRVTAGDVGSIVVTTNSAAPGTITRYTRRTAAWVEEKIFYTTEADATTMTVSLLGLNNGDVVEYGQVLVIEGYIPGPFRQFNETLVFKVFIQDANWNLSNKSTGTTTIDYSIDYSGLILAGTRALLLFIFALDTGQAAGTCYESVRFVGSANDLLRHELSFEPVAGGQHKNQTGWAIIPYNMQLDYYILATGVNTTNLSVPILGIQI